MMGIYIKDIPMPEAGQEIEIAEGITGMLYARIKSQYDEWHEIIVTYGDEKLINSDGLEIL